MALMARITEYIRSHGLSYTFRRAGEMLGERLLHTWDRQYRREAPAEEELDEQRKNPPEAGLISVVVPVYNTKPAFLQALLCSLLDQTYPEWEAILYDGGSTNAATLRMLDSFSGNDRIHVLHGDQNEGISGNTNQAIPCSEGRYIALCDHDDVLAPDALWHVARAIEADAPDLIYTDEDRLTEDGRLHIDPHRKPDFRPDDLRSGNYICHLMTIRREMLEAVGGLRPAFDGSQDHDLALRVAERTERICHIPRVLYHWRVVGSSMGHQRLAQCQDAAARAVTEHMQRVGYPGICTVEDGVLRLRWDVSSKMTVKAIRIPAAMSPQERYAFMNREAASAQEDMLFFVGEDVTDMQEGSLRELMMYAQRDDVAAVTPMLTDWRGRITHAGFSLTGGEIRCRNAGLPWHAGGWHGMNRTSHNVAAVSAACFLIRRDHFIPFDESYSDGLGAVAWCLRQRQRGLRCVYTPHARATCENRPLLSRWTEMERLRAAWPDGFPDGE